MVEWGLVAKIAGGGYGLCILVLVVILLVVWITGLVIQRAAKAATKHEEEAAGK